MKSSIVALLIALAAGAASAQDATATATLKDAKGQPAGTATFTQSGGIVKVKVAATGLTPGKHGIHVHEAGKCDGPDFKSAGAHFNPHGRKHGLDNDQGAHGGDMPNLEASGQGAASLQFVLHGLTLDPGEAKSLLDANGSALVIHAKADDQKTDPAGDSGDRVACGVIAATR
jgi:Cu-Zn family superoxide dismutase